MKRLSIFVVLAFVLSTAIASANPFSDVPFSHWAYDAVNKLAAKGLLQGYPDGTFKGEKHVTRYALAMVVAKLLANVEQMMEKGVGSNLVTKSDLQTLEKLTVEFADELALLGVKVTALEDDMQVVKEDVSTLKKDVEGIKDYMAKGGMEKVKLSGDMLVRHTSLIHNRDWAVNGFGNVNNAQTETQLRFQFKANIDENITAVARWRMLNKADLGAGNVGNVNGTRWGYAGIGVHGADASADIDVAYLHIKDMFRFGGDFTFGRNFYATGHSLLLSDYVDAFKYYKRSGDVDVAFYSIYDSHRGSWEDDGTVNYKNLWAITLGTKYHDHDLYLNFFAQPDAELIQRRFQPFTTGIFNALTGSGISYHANSAAIFLPAPGTALPGQALAYQKNDMLFDVEFGSKGPLGRNGHWDYDLGFAYTGYDANFVTGTVVDATNVLATNWTDVQMDGWLGHVAVKWDSKKEWAAKLGWTFATDEAVGALSLDNDRRYDDGVETPYEDISRGNQYFANGLMNMWDLKLQVEYRPRNTKHYFRLAGDFLDEMKDTVSNDMARLAAVRNKSGMADIPAATIKSNTIYDRWNNFGSVDPQAFVLTFEYRYQLAENTRIRVGYTAFDMTGDNTSVTPATSFAGLWNRSIKGGRGTTGDFDYNMFWAELYSRF